MFRSIYALCISAPFENIHFLFVKQPLVKPLANSLCLIFRTHPLNSELVQLVRRHISFKDKLFSYPYLVNAVPDKSQCQRGVLHSVHIRKPSRDAPSYLRYSNSKSNIETVSPSSIPISSSLSIMPLVLSTF